MFLQQLAYLPATLRLIWAAAGRWMVAWILLLIIQGVLPAATVYLTGWSVDALVAAQGGGLAWANIRPAIIPVSLMAATLLVGQLMSGLLNWVRSAQSEYVQDYLSGLIHEKAIELDMAFFENPEDQNRLFQAHQDLKNRPLSVLENGGAMFQNAITLISVSALLVPYGIWLPVLLLLSGLPVVYVILRHNRIHHAWWERTTTDRRWADYFDRLMLLDVAAPEIKIFNLGPYFRDSFQSLRKVLRSETLKMVRNQGLAQFGSLVLGILAGGSIMAWMVYRAFLGQISLGDLALFYQAINRCQSVMNSFLSSAGKVYSNTLFLSGLFSLLELKPEVGDPAEPVRPPKQIEKGVVFEGVSFHYPGTERLVLDDFNFFLQAGKITAIVGANGAGKTTLVKLMCRFYDPQSGSITFDGKDIREFNVTDLRRMLTVMFQFPLPFVSTVEENIRLGDLERKLTEKDLEAVAAQAGADEFVCNLPQKYKSVLGKYFPDGVQLSGGELQRLALARLFWRNAPIMILDEPTSSMDSWSEHDWYERFRQTAAGRTAVLITHRFTTARRADIVHVMEHGRMVESGTHEELLEMNGRYATSWRNQNRELDSAEKTSSDDEP